MKYFLSLIAACLLVVGGVIAQDSPVGVWKTIDDESGEAKSHVEIYESNGKFYGKIVKLLTLAEDAVCDQCPDDLKNKPMMGLKIVNNLEPYRDYWSYGTIMDPKTGKVYKCSIFTDGPNKLRVRGYIGFSALGRNQIWHRVK